MKLALEMLISLKHTYFPSIKNNIVNTMTILTLIRLSAYITISHYNMFTLLPITLFTDIDTSFLLLLNIFDTDNSLYLLSLPLITPLKVFDYRIINETMDRDNIRNMNTRSIITQRIFNWLTILDHNFSQTIQPMEFELVNWIELASDEQLSNLVTDIFSQPLILHNLKLKGINTNLRIRKHIIYQMINNNELWKITNDTPIHSNNIIDKIKTIILTATGLNLLENQDNNMGFSNDPNQLFELDAEGFITGVSTFPKLILLPLIIIERKTEM